MPLKLAPPLTFSFTMTQDRAPRGCCCVAVVQSRGSPCSAASRRSAQQQQRIHTSAEASPDASGLGELTVDRSKQHNHQQQQQQQQHDQQQQQQRQQQRQQQQQQQGCNYTNKGPVPCSATPAANAAAAQQAAAAAAAAAALQPVAVSLLQSGPLLVTAGAFVCSFISLQVKLFDHPVSPLQVTAVNSGVAWLATSSIMKAAGISTGFGCQARGVESVSLLLLRGVLAATTVVCYYAAIESLPLSVAVALFFFNPVFCVMLDAAVTGRRISCTALASCLLTVLGVLTIGWHDQLLQYIEHLTEAVQAVQAVHGVQPEAVQSAVQSAVSSAPHGADLPISGVLFGLAAAAANAAAFVCVGVIGPSVSPWSLTWWQHLVVTHVAAAAILAQNLGQANTQLSSSKVSELSSLLSSIGGGGSAAAAAGLCGTNSTSSNTMSDVWSDLTAQTSDALGQLVLPRSSGHDALLLLGVVAANFMGQLLLNAGFQRMDAGRGSAINTSQVLFGCVWDVLLLHSPASSAMWLGSGAIAAGVFGITMADERLTDDPDQV